MTSRIQPEMPPKLLTHQDLVILPMLLCSKLMLGIKEPIPAWTPKLVPTKLWATSVVKLRRMFQMRPRTERAMAVIGPRII